MDSNNCANEKTLGDGSIGCCGYILIFLSYIIFLVTLPLSLCASIHVVHEYQRGVVFRLGRAKKGGAKGPGLIFTLSCAEQFTLVDLRIKSFDIPLQEIFSKDSVTVAVDAVIYCYVYDPVMSVCNIQDAFGSTRLLAATTLRTVLGTKNLADMLSERDVISKEMQKILDESTDPWGVKVERVEIKDVRLPRQLQRAMATEAEASREASAKVIAAKGEQKASASLKEAAVIMSQCPAAVQLRYLQTLSSIATEKNSTIIFPLPMEFLKGMTAKQ
ncbi:mechanosensory protein 2-like [Pecten maximus]|uniref:mechanosensory protein 2-like n=1 Tax=Pecten maximus TaxID=6579 RepID=UPI0014582149|nr:mechanosensory protein 2-like [Pecten maximus]